MNHIVINNLTDLQQIIETPIYIPKQINEENYPNMWAITFSNELITQLELKDLTEFLSKLLQKRNKQLYEIDPKLIATFYLWFDIQASQLRFNILFGNNLTLPFGCKLNILYSYESILDNFLITESKFAIEGDMIEFIDPKYDQDDEDNEYILDVYVQVLNCR